MKREIPWPRLVAEGVIIILSILLALAGQAWWEGRQDRAEEREILRGLETDFVANLEQLANVHRQLEDQARGISNLLDLHDAGDYDAPPDRSYPAAVNNPRTFTSQDGTLDAVIATGRLRVIDDVDLRDVLVRWKNVVIDSEEQAEDYRAASRDVVSRASELGGPWYFDPQEQTGQAAVPAVAEIRRRQPHLDMPVLVGDAEIMARLREKRFAVSFYLYMLARVLETGENALALVRAARQDGGPSPRIIETITVTNSKKSTGCPFSWMGHDGTSRVGSQSIIAAPRSRVRSPRRIGATRR